MKPLAWCVQAPARSQYSPAPFSRCAGLISSASAASLTFITGPVYAAGFLIFSKFDPPPAVMRRRQRLKCQVGRRNGHFCLFSLRRPADRWAVGGLARVDFSHKSIHFNHNGSSASSGGSGGVLLIDWQVFAYTVCDKMSRPASALTCAGCRQNKLMRVIYHAACAHHC